MWSVSHHDICAAAQVALGHDTRVLSYSVSDLIEPGNNFGSHVVCVQAMVTGAKQDRAVTSERQNDGAVMSGEQDDAVKSTDRDGVMCSKQCDGLMNSDQIAIVSNLVRDFGVSTSRREEDALAFVRQGEPLTPNEGRDMFGSCKRGTVGEMLVHQRTTTAAGAEANDSLCERYNLDKDLTGVTISLNNCESVHNTMKSNKNNEYVWSCIVKLNSKKESIFFKTFSKFAFENEIKFYASILPELNRELSKSKITSISVPPYYFYGLDAGNETLFLEDLRCYRFHVADKYRGLDESQAAMALVELAKMHAASYLLDRHARTDETVHSFQRQRKLGRCQSDLEEEPNRRQLAFMSIKNNNYLHEDGPIMNLFVVILKNRLCGALKHVENNPGMEKATAWLRGILNDIPHFLRQMLCDCKHVFRVLCHGDTWTNNFLYSSSSEFAYMLDFQLIRPASLATDIVYLLYTSGDHTSHTESLLNAYYRQWTAVMEGQSEQVPFTRAELSAEVASKRSWGVVGALITLPMIFPPVSSSASDGTQGAVSAPTYDAHIVTVARCAKEETSIPPVDQAGDVLKKKITELLRTVCV